MVSAAAQHEIDRLFSVFDPVDPPLAERRANWERDSLLEPLPEGARHTEVVAGGMPSEWMEMPGADPKRVFLCCMAAAIMPARQRRIVSLPPISARRRGFAC